MSQPITMRKSILSLFLLLALGLYALSSLTVKERQTAKSGDRGHFLQISAEFPLEDKPVARSNKDRIVSFSDILKDVTPAVVGVYPSRIVKIREGRRYNPLEEMLRRYYGLPIPQHDEDVEPEERKLPQGMGSGVIVSPDGYILTNHHVITDDRGNVADEIEVQLNDGRRFIAAIVGKDERTDIAVLKIDEDDLPSLDMADSDNLQVGDIVFAVGNPLSVGLTVTMGIVSATGRTGLGILIEGGYENFIQTDASINPGNSGGALVDAEGRLVGINTAIISRTGGNIGLGFAIPITLGRNIMLSLIDSGAVQRGLLGVRIDNLTREMAEAFNYEGMGGALVQSVEDGLPASIAGIQRGDIIVDIGGKKISTSNDLRLTVASMPPGTAVTVTVVRGGEKRAFEVVLSDMENPHSLASGTATELLYGVVLESLNSRYRENYTIPDRIEGLIVTDVKRRSPHSNSLREGMVIIEINDNAVRDPSALATALRSGPNKLWTYDRGSYGYQVIRVE